MKIIIFLREKFIGWNSTFKNSTLVWSVNEFHISISSTIDIILVEKNYYKHSRIDFLQKQKVYE